MPVIDLRWSISELVDPDHRNTQLSLEEIEACQKLSAAPTLIVNASTAVHTQSLWLKGDIQDRPHTLRSTGQVRWFSKVVGLPEQLHKSAS